MSLRTLSVVAAGAVYLQLVLGALMRHTGAGLAIPDFPLAFGRLVPPFDSPAVVTHFAHRMGALLVACCVGVAAGRVLQRHRDEPALARPAALLVGLVCVQILLGGVTVWTRKAVVPATLHVLTGALVLATSAVLALRSHRLVVAPQRATFEVLSTPRVAT